MTTQIYKKRLYDESNIFLALFSVHSYVKKYELLSKKDQNEYEDLRDVFNEKNINKWIIRVRERLDDLLKNDGHLQAKVYFRPKKYKDGPVFRPLHHAPLLDQITAVAMLNILIYTFDAQGKVGMSGLTRLIPNNFYGNRVAYDIEHLFTPWDMQYKEYNRLINEAYTKYHENLEYKWEVNLDLKNFFPSINPIVLYKYIASMISVNLDEEDRDFILKILEKLIFIEIEELNDDDLNRYRDKKFDFKCIYAQGIPQGLPQSYFLANLLMIEIAEKYKKVFPSSEMYFYVDDSVIFTNDISNEKELKDKIDELNTEIYEWERSELEDALKEKTLKISQEKIEYVQERMDSYGISVHEPGDKSTASNISADRDLEIYLNHIGRETSNIAFELNTNFTDEEIMILLHKTEKLYEAVKNALDNINKEIGEQNDENVIGKIALKNKLIRYKKFLKYRCYRLMIRVGKNNDEIIKDFLDDLKRLVKKKNIKEFFELFTEDVFSGVLNLLLRELCDSDKNLEIKVDDVIKLLKKLNKMVFEEDNKKTSYIYQFIIKYYEKDFYNANENSEYRSLKKKVAKQIRFYKNKTDEFRKSALKNELALLRNDNIVNVVMGDGYARIVKLVDDNSASIRRMLLNASISVILGVEISDDYLLHKTINRNITYTELRILVMLRSKKFNDKKFLDLIDSFLDEKYNCAIDYSIFHVLGYFKTYISEIDRVDKLILVHKYTCDIWKNGSKHLYFYTLHNQEHAVDLIINSVKLVRTIDYIDLKKYDYYILFIACYLHDISMVTFPLLDAIQEDGYKTNELYTDFFNDIKESYRKEEWSNKSVKKILRDYYLRIDEFYENLVRENHAKNSADEIRKKEDLSFIDSALRELVAEVSEAHGYDIVDVYSKKSNARKQNWSEKYTKILLRMADLLDMSNYRVSRMVLNHNLKNMGKVSRFHWLSHLVTKGYDLCVKYEFNDSVKANKDNYLKKKNIIETIILTVVVDLPQMTQVSSPNCKEMNLKSISGNKVLLDCGTECNSTKCNFLCKWFSVKNEFLFWELSALKMYLNSAPNNYFETKIEVIIKSTDKSILSQEQFTYLANYINEK